MCYQGVAIHPFLSPIPVSGPLDWLGSDVIQFTSSSKGNKYAIAIVDYLTKWPEDISTQKREFS